MQATEEEMLSQTPSEFNLLTDVQPTGIPREEIPPEEFLEQIPTRVQDIGDLYPYRPEMSREQLQREAEALAEGHRIYEQPSETESIHP